MNILCVLVLPNQRKQNRNSGVANCLSGRDKSKSISLKKIKFMPLIIVVDDWDWTKRSKIETSSVVNIVNFVSKNLRQKWIKRPNKHFVDRLSVVEN